MSERLEEIIRTRSLDFIIHELDLDREPVLRSRLRNLITIAERENRAQPIIDYLTNTELYTRGNLIRAVQSPDALASFLNQNPLRRNTLDHMLELVFELGIRDLEVLRLLTTAGANTLEFLMGAIYHGNLEVLEVLLRTGTNPNTNYVGDTPLLFAIDQQQTDAVKLLLDYGANPDMYVTNVTFEYSIPLTLSILHGNITLVNLLLEYGANVHVLNDMPLALAAERGYTEIVETLLNYGANAYIERISIERNHLDTIELLEPYQPNELANALVKASYGGFIEKIRRLLKTETLPDPALQLALINAVQLKNQDMILLLLEYCAPPVNETTTIINDDMNRRDFGLYKKIGDPVYGMLTDCRKKQLLRILRELKKK